MAKKNKLSKQQIRRLRNNQQKKLESASNRNAVPEDNKQPTEKGVVVSRYGQHADIQTVEGELKRCDIRRTVRSLVAGDNVLWQPVNETQSDVDGVIEVVEERQTILNRPDYYDGLKPVAANIEQVVIVSSIKPDLSLQIIDRYLVAVEDIGAQPVIVVNKIELLSDKELDELTTTMTYYKKIGYAVHLISVKENVGVDTLLSSFNQKTSIVVGQSGVGKSSLINLLLPNVNLLVNEISENSGLGQHTTTVSKLFNLPRGGTLIDSPGVREFALWHLSNEAIFDGFIEFSEYRTCRFRDCKHRNTPSCGITTAVEQGDIAQSRLDSYYRIIDSKVDERPSRFSEH